MNHDLVLWANNTGGDLSNTEGNGIAYGANLNSVYNIHEIERPDDYLVEIHGASLHLGDAAGDGEGSKCDVWLYNDAELEGGDGLASWIDREGAWGEHLIWHGSQQSTATGNGIANEQIWFKRPILSTGTLSVHETGDPATTGGEFGVMVYYTFVETSQDNVLRQLINVR